MRRFASSSKAAWLLLIIGFLFSHSIGAADGFGEHYRRAETLYEEGRYAESISELRAAYDVKPLPRLLLNIGQLHLKLRQPKEALDAYDAYRRTVPAPPPAVEATLSAGMAQAQAMLIPTAPPPAVALVPRRPAPKAQPLFRRWWFWGGLGLVATGVATGVALGVTLPARATAPGDLEVLDVSFRSLGRSPVGAIGVSF